MKRVLSLTLMMMLIAIPAHAVKIQFSNDVTGAIEEAQGSDGRINTSSRINTRSFYISRDDGQVYTFNSEFAANNGEEVIYIKNTSSTKKLHISSLILSAASEVDWDVFEVTSGTPAGTTITGKNLNLSSSNDASATSFGDASVTGTLTGDTISHARSSSATTVILTYGSALILGQNDDIAVTYGSSSSGEINVTIQGFFE